MMPAPAACRFLSARCILVEMIAQGTVAAPKPDDIYIVNDPYLGPI